MGIIVSLDIFTNENETGCIKAAEILVIPTLIVEISPSSFKVSLGHPNLIYTYYVKPEARVTVDIDEKEEHNFNIPQSDCHIVLKVEVRNDTRNSENTD